MVDVHTITHPIAGARSIPTILIVEDEKSLLHLLETVLPEEFACRVVSSSSMQRALTLAEQLSPPQLLLLDYHLPDGNGIVLYDQLQQKSGWQNIPMLIMSAAPPLTELAARHINYLKKPFALDHLLEVVGDNLDTNAKSVINATTLPHQEQSR